MMHDVADDDDDVGGRKAHQPRRLPQRCRRGLTPLYEALGQLGQDEPISG